jgi:hypothetical protein
MLADSTSAANDRDFENVPLADIGKTTSIFGVGGRGLQPQLADAVVEYLLRLLTAARDPSRTRGQKR